MTIPKEVKNIIERLNKAGFEAYIVGGCVRDFLLGQEPYDWDVTTNAKPEEIQKVFPDSFYENKFLTVTVRSAASQKRGEPRPNESFGREIEITTYRSEAKYTDKRHPDEVKYAKTLVEDLSRRDFTVNAFAMDMKKKVTDMFNGQQDLKNKIIRAVGNPQDRFAEDALRMMRAVRFATVLDFSIEEGTAEAIKENSASLADISKERIRDELLKIIMSQNPAKGIELLRELDLLKYIIPELLENYGVSQSKHHIFDCYTHAVKSLEYAAKKNFNMRVRVAALLHDVGKARTKKGAGDEAIFYNHEIVGANMTYRILERLKFPKKEVEKISKLVRYHLFYYNANEVGASSVRRLVKNVGPENMEDLLLLRQSDRIGSGVPKAEPYKLRHLKYLVEKVARDPLSAKMLKISGEEVMNILNIKPGPKVGQILDILLGHVLADPKNNNKEFLDREVESLGKISDNELLKQAEKARKERQEIETKKDQMTKSKYWVT